MLDPFAGSGTVGQVAQELDRNAVLIELNPVYVEMQKQRRAIRDLVETDHPKDDGPDGPSAGWLF